MSAIKQMVDIETLATRPDAIILSIGACRFNVSTGEIFDKFYLNIDPKSCKAIGLKSDKDTIDWWKRQHPDVIAVLTENQVDVYNAMMKFHSWLNKDQELWAYGLNFDVPIIEFTSKALNLAPAWKYYKLRCARTLCEFASIMPERVEGSHHNALDDSIAQAEAIVKIFQLVA